MERGDGQVGLTVALVPGIHADTSILQAQLGWTGTTMPDLATRIVAQAQSRYGQGAAACLAFQDRGILTCS